jgi:hypothetical protein
VTHLAVTIDAPTENCELTKTCPKDNSTKIAPDFNGYTPLPHLWMAGTSSIKALASDKFVASFGIDPPVGADVGSIIVWTGAGPRLEGAIWTPSCCEKTNLETQSFIKPYPGSTERISVTYDSCTGDADIKGATPVKVAFCDGDEESYDPRSCHEIDTFGLRSGFALTACVNDKSHIFFGFADSVWHFPPTDADCTPGAAEISAAGATCISEQVINDTHKVYYDVATCSQLEWICVRDSNGEFPVRDLNGDLPLALCDQSYVLNCPAGPGEACVWIAADENVDYYLRGG